jgi:hypothetical protein
VAAQARTSSVVPAAAVDERGVRPSVLRIENGKTEKAEVTLGLRDGTTETVEILSGVQPGDTVLLGIARGLATGTRVKITSPADAKDSK